MPQPMKKELDNSSPKIKSQGLRFAPPDILPRAKKQFIDALIATRSYFSGPANYARCFQYETFEVRMTLKEELKTPHFFFLKVSYPDGHAEDVLFKKEGLHLTARIDTAHCGRVNFILKVIDDSGKVFLDQNDQSYLLVDPASMKNLRMYTLIPAQSGHIGDWINWLDHIKALGFNAVHLLPITMMGKSNSPYAAKSLTQIDPRFAIPGDERSLFEQFETFITRARALGILVCLDFVLNHVAIDSEFFEKRSDWLIPDVSTDRKYRHAGCWHEGKWMEWEDLFLINYQTEDLAIREELWKYMTEVALFWTQFADMVRFDNLHSSYQPFITHALTEMRKIKPDLIIFAEYFDNHFELEKVIIELGLNLVLATPWGVKFLPELSDYLRYLNAYHPQISFFNMPVSHDSGSALQEFAHPEYAKLRYFVTLFAASPYSGMVQGYEYVLEQKLEFIDVKTPVEFKKSPRNISDFIKHCHGLADSHPVLSAKALKIANTDSVLAVLKSDLEHHVLILLNMNIHQNAVIPFELPEKFTNAKEIFGTTANNKIGRKLRGGLNEISLVPGEMAVYIC